MTEMSIIDVSEEQFTTEEIEITTEDGHKLKGRVFSPLVPPEAITIIHAATGTPASYYESYAKWLCENRRVKVLVYDYRDFGRSANQHLRESKATMADWGVKDQSAILSYVVSHYDGLPIWAIGHSLGGLCLPFHQDADKVSKFVTVASGPAHWRRHPPFFIPLALLFWWVLGPISTSIVGYLPGRKLGLGADVPAGVYWQWRRWCITTGFYKMDWGKRMPEPDLQRFTGELYITAFEDDTSIPPYVAEDLAQFYPAAKTSVRVFKPEDFGLNAIGHIGAFSKYKKELWPSIVSF